MTSDRSLPPWSHMQLLARIAPIRTATSRAGAYARVPSPSVRAVLEFHTRTTLCPHAGVLHSRDARSRWSSTLARCHSPECRRWLHPALKRCTASAAKLSCFTADSAHVRFRATWCISHEKLSCFTADSAHVRFRATWCISHETVVRYCRRSPRSAFEQRVASARTVVRYCRRSPRPAFE